MTDSNGAETDFQSLYDLFCGAFMAGDNEALAKFYSDTAVMVLPAGRVLSGRSEIQTFWTRTQKIQALHFESTAGRRLGDEFQRDIGDLQVTARGVGRQTRVVNAKFMCLWQRLNGRWVLDTFVWSRAGGQAGNNRRVGFGTGVPGRGNRPGGGRPGIAERGAGQGGRFSRQNQARGDELPPMVPRTD